MRVLDKYGQGTVSNALAALNWCLQNKSKYNIRVANLSLGHPPGESYTTDPLCQACEQAWKGGILVVSAAGNRGRKVASDRSTSSAFLSDLIFVSDSICAASIRESRSMIGIDSSSDCRKAFTPTINCSRVSIAFC